MRLRRGASHSRMSHLGGKSSRAIADLSVRPDPPPCAALTEAVSELLDSDSSPLEDHECKSAHAVLHL